MAKSVITNIYNALTVWNHSTTITECQFSEQAVFTLLLPLFDRCRDYEIFEVSFIFGMNVTLHLTL